MGDMALKRQERYFLALFNLFLLVSCISPALCGDIFFWTDERGIHHYSNVRPPNSAYKVEIYREKGDQEGQNQDMESESHKSDSGYLGVRPPYPVDNGTLSFKVLRIYDGDSMKIEGGELTVMVRLVGIDAPESGGGKGASWKKRVGKSGSRADGQPFSQEAKEALARMVGSGDIHIKSYGTDRYNRLLAEVFTADGTLVNLELIREGMAEVYRDSPPEGFEIAPYKRAELEAKRYYKGIWSLGSEYQSPKIWRKANPRK